jgi:hypothetical protein
MRSLSISFSSLFVLFCVFASNLFLRRRNCYLHWIIHFRICFGWKNQQIRTRLSKLDQLFLRLWILFRIFTIFFSISYFSLLVKPDNQNGLDMVVVAHFSFDLCFIFYCCFSFFLPVLVCCNYRLVLSHRIALSSFGFFSIIFVFIFSSSFSFFSDIFEGTVYSDADE